MKHSFRTSLVLLLLGTALACKSDTPAATDTKAKAAKTETKPDTKPVAKADTKPVDTAKPIEPAPTTANPTEPAPTTAVPVEPPPTDANADVVLDESKDFYGLAVPEIDGWKATWEPDTVGIQWSKPGNVEVSMVINENPITKVEDIEHGFMAGTKLSKQDPPTKTTKGWYTIVTTEDGKTEGFVYVRQIGKSWLACDTMTSRGEGDARAKVSAEKLVEICESANLP